MNQGPVRILVVDDSPAMQKLFSLLLQPESISGSCRLRAVRKKDGDISAARCRRSFCSTSNCQNRPGIDLLRRIMAERPTPVVIVSANGGVDSANTLEALAAGAVAFVEKPNAVDTSVDDFESTCSRDSQPRLGTERDLCVSRRS